MSKIGIKKYEVTPEFYIVQREASQGNLNAMEELSNLYFEMGDKYKCFLWRDTLQTLLRIEIDAGLKELPFELIPYHSNEDAYNKSQERVSKLKEYEKGIINGGKGINLFYGNVDEDVEQVLLLREEFEKDFSGTNTNGCLHIIDY